MTTSAFEVTAGVIPGQPIQELTKVFPYQSEDFENDKQVPEDQPTKFSELSEEAHTYARSLQDPSKMNWVRVDWVWF